MSKQYVQHISGQGEKFQVVEEGRSEVFEAKLPLKNGNWYCLRLPKSEYRLCEPPERWVDVTKNCEVYKSAETDLLHNNLVCVSWTNGYRLRKVKLWTSYNAQGDNTQWAFIVEEKED